VRVLHDVRTPYRGGEWALHRLQPPGGASIQDEHYPTLLPTGVRPPRPPFGSGLELTGHINFESISLGSRYHRSGRGRGDVRSQGAA
jgi:hypothetical protein